VDQTKWGAGSTGYNLLGIDAELDDSDDEDDAPSLGSNTNHCTRSIFSNVRATARLIARAMSTMARSQKPTSLPSEALDDHKLGRAWASGDGGDLGQGTTRRF
jgi:hypothetical protein